MSDYVDTDLKRGFHSINEKLDVFVVPVVGTLTGMLESMTVERMGVGRA